MRANPRPSMVLISIDTLRADRLTAYGGNDGLTPNLDRLAAAGIVYEAAIASSSWTLPSVASFLTGLQPARHGAGPSLNGFDLMARAPLRPENWTLAEGLRAAGYATHAVVSNPYLAPQYGLDAGFDTYENVSLAAEALAAAEPALAGKLAAPFLRQTFTDNAARVTARGLRRLESLRCEPGAARERPFFLWLHYIDPHAPYGCAGGSKSFRGDTLLSGIHPRDTDLHQRFEAIARLRAGEIRLTAPEKGQLIALYDAGVAEVDRQIGRVLERVGLCANGGLAVPDDMLLAVVSDHGEEFWEHGGVEHGHTFYDELVRVPLILAGAGLLPAGQRVRELVRLLDLPPTVLDILGLPGPSGLDGTPLPVPRGVGCDTAAPRVALCESLLFAEEKVAVRDRQRQRRLAGGDLPLARPAPGAVAELEGAAFANLAADPLFPNNVYAVWNTYQSGSSEVVFNRSTDGGATWLAQPVRVNGVITNDQFLPRVATTIWYAAEPDVTAIRVIWYDRRIDPNNLGMEVYGNISFDGGLSWGGDDLWTAVPSPLPQLCPNFDCNFAPCYFGDYIGLSGMNPANSLFIAGWGDTRFTAQGTPCSRPPGTCPDIPRPSISPDPDIRAAVGC